MPKQVMPIIIAAAVLLTCQQCCCASAVQLSEAEIDAKLFELKPLPKVHYSTPVSPELSNQRLYELARITHSLCVSGEWTKQEHIDKFVYICARVNKAKPAIKASLAINFSPWHRRFDKKLPPTDRGPTYWKEIDYFVLHQPNKYILQNIAKRLGLGEEKIPSQTGSVFGNQNSASIPGTINGFLYEKFSNHKLKNVFVGFGIGLSWGACYVETGAIYTPQVKTFDRCYYNGSGS